MSSGWFVDTISSRNCLCFKSNSIILSKAMVSLPVAPLRTLVLLASVLLALTNLMNSGSRCFPFVFFTAVSYPPAMASKTYSCLHQYFSPDSDFGYELGLCSSLARLPQCSHVGCQLVSISLD